MFHGQFFPFRGGIFLQDWCCKRENRGCVKFQTYLAEMLQSAKDQDAVKEELQ